MYAFRENLHGDVNPRFHVNDSVEPSIRAATAADIDFWLPRAQQLYPARPIMAMEPWIRWALNNEDCLILVGKNSCGMARVSWFYGVDRKARMEFLFGSPSWETLKMVRLMVAWAKVRGATGKFRLTADTGVDFGPFAKRLGGHIVEQNPQYDIPLE